MNIFTHSLSTVFLNSHVLSLICWLLWARFCTWVEWSIVYHTLGVVQNISWTIKTVGRIKLLWLVDIVIPCAFAYMNLRSKHCILTVQISQHKKASNHHANHTPGNVQFYIVTTWETPGNHWYWWPDTLIIVRALARVIIKVLGHQHQWFPRCFPGGYNVKLYISRGRLAWWLLAFLHSVCTFRFQHILVER